MGERLIIPKLSSFRDVLTIIDIPMALTLFQYNQDQI